ncbi:MAG: efflux transporter periplasmic adaptor subunit [Sterolibacteriaceae bacterium]|uniref:Efflux transporter periplasmic adaptor subunit n=1 Tax=Candidatus Methylophosphatis roskildensis TaxID=2899263 RepID=A0A9D7HWN3_9PROT|nr:efflux transporter periplasmic adaptor subunit [Candidatus Methylophosphatis roskildensis]
MASIGFSPTRPRYRAARGIGICLWLAIGAPALAADHVDINAAQIKALGIEVAPLGARRAAELGGLAAQVVVPNRQMYVVSAPLAALIGRIGGGQRVGRAGQVLARLQSPMLAELQRGYLQSSVQARLAADKLQRDEALFRDGIIAESRLRTSRGQQAEAGAALAERRQALRMAGVRVCAGQARCRQGRWRLDRRARAGRWRDPRTDGQRGEPSRPPHRSFGWRNSIRWLEIQVPAAKLARISAGAAVSVPAAKSGGRVVSIGRSVGANQTALVRAEITAGSAALNPGQMVEASIGVADATNEPCFRSRPLRSCVTKAACCCSCRPRPASPRHRSRLPARAVSAAA